MPAQAVAPYRVRPAEAVDPKTPFLCRIGLHRRFGIGLRVDGRRAFACERCGLVEWLPRVIFFARRSRLVRIRIG